MSEEVVGAGWGRGEAGTWGQESPLRSGHGSASAPIVAFPLMLSHLFFFFSLQFLSIPRKTEEVNVKSISGHCRNI